MTQKSQVAKTNDTLAVKKRDITASVLNKINVFEKNGELRLPKDYSPENALKSAYLVLSEAETRDKKPVLEACSQQSIANALLKMVVYGLSPLKKQVYFVPYGNTLDCTVSYTGNIAMAKRYAGLVDIKANLIMEGEEFEFEVAPNTGRKSVTKHIKTLESVGTTKIKGAYAIYVTEDGQTDMDVMTMEQIKTSWEQGATKGKSPAHTKFPGEMAKRTVMNRAIKILLRSSDDSVLYDAIDRDDIDVVKEDVAYKVQENANGEILDIEAEDVTEDAKEMKVTDPEEVVPPTKPEQEEEESEDAKNERLLNEQLKEEGQKPKVDKDGQGSLL